MFLFMHLFMCAFCQPQKRKESEIIDERSPFFFFSSFFFLPFVSGAAIIEHKSVMVSPAPQFDTTVFHTQSFFLLIAYSLSLTHLHYACMGGVCVGELPPHLYIL